MTTQTAARNTISSAKIAFDAALAEAKADHAAKPKAATWTRADKTTWDVKFNGYSFTARKIDGTWNLFVWNEMADDWSDVEVEAQSALRPFWNAVTAFFQTSEDYQVANPLEGYVVEDNNTPDVEPADPADLCPKCGKFGDEKCVTSSGKAVKENGGYHAVRPGH